MTQKLKVLQVVFDGNIQTWEIPVLREAISSKVGPESILFHNQKGLGYRYGYPVIQYKCFQNRPVLICIGEGVDEVYHYFSQPGWSVEIEISGRTLPMKILDIRAKEYLMEVSDQMFAYRIYHWVSLNQEAHREFLQIAGLPEQIPFLEKKMTANILSMARGIGWYVEEKIETKIRRFSFLETVNIKGVRMPSMYADFTCNIKLPHAVGLGKNAGIGYGTVWADVF